MKNNLNYVFFNITYGHKPYVSEKGFLPIAAGGGRVDIKNDDTGDNISDKNPWYGELTAVYWAWKNLKDFDVVGFSHYRRYLAKLHWVRSSNFRITPKMLMEDNRHQMGNFVNDINNYDFVMQHHWTLSMTNREQFLSVHHCPEVIDVARIVIEELHPESLRFFDEYWNDNKSIMWCIFITKWEKFRHLCEWMFPVLFEVEKRLDKKRYTGYNQRIIAFLYERLINVYLRSENLSVKEYPVYVIVESKCYAIWLQELNKYIMRVSKFLFNRECCLFKEQNIIPGCRENS